MSQLKNHSLLAFTAPLILPFVGVILLITSPGEIEAKHMFIVAAYGAVSYAGFFALGYPLAKILDKRNRLSICTLLVGGFACGVIVLVLFGIATGFFLRDGFPPSMGWFVTFGGLGMLVALCFGLLARVRWFRDPFQDT